MNFVFTPFALIVFLVTAALLALASWCFFKGHLKSGALIVVVMILVAVFKPIKLTTNTEQVNARSDTAVMEKHERQLKELPPRVIVERKSYDETLADESAKLTK